MALAALALCGCSSQKVTSEEGVSSETPGAETAPPSVVRTYDIPRFATNSPFKTEYKSPVPDKGKRLWARSCLWEKAPELTVEKWLTDKPDAEGKYLLIEFWATWCRQCRLAIPRLNELHVRFGDELAVIGISDEREEIVRRHKEPIMEFHVAIDTQGRMKEKMGVFGIPHAIIVEPGGHVVWEGFPLLKGHELTDQVVEKILAVGRNQRAALTNSP
ncbi:MAG TPA: TlpA family protein disulfide reductase [Phycisphaerales bacterium]|nr:TlpA family protein disulfide reductase [Phycisphaerales bacterium]